jgi:acetylglutamate kinase
VEQAILKAEVLIEALGYIRQFRDRLTVFKLGGSAMENAAALRATLLDLVFMETVGMRPIVVHGGGAAISRAMNDAGLEPRFVRGRRYTDQKTLDIVARVLTDEINKDLVGQIEQLGGRAAALHYRTTNCLKGERITLEDESGQAVDLGFVGRVTEVDRRVIENLCFAGVVPVIPSLAIDASGQRLNVNADTAAAAVARELRAEKLVFLSDVSGILREPANPESLANSLTAAECRELIDQGVIGSGMIPKVEACLESLEAGVRKTHIVDGRVRHSLLLEIYTDRGVGTEIVLKKKGD